MLKVAVEAVLVNVPPATLVIQLAPALLLMVTLVPVRNSEAGPF